MVHAATAVTFAVVALGAASAMAMPSYECVLHDKMPHRAFN